MTDTSQQTRQYQPPALEPQPGRSWSGIVILVLSLFGLLYGLCIYQIKPLLTMRFPQHDPLPIDSPPVELTSFQIRAGGVDLTPTAIAAHGDSVYVCFAEEPLIQIYNSRLGKVGVLNLDRPAPVTPAAIAVTDSFLIVADSLKDLLAVFDHDGTYVSSVAWYPGHKVRIHPARLATDGKLLAVVDPRAAQIAVISLINRQPFYDFLELMDLIPGEDRSRLQKPSAAAITPEGSIWVGDCAGRALIYSPFGEFVNDLESPTKTKITLPVAFAASQVAEEVDSLQFRAVGNWQPDRYRVHLLDQASGKVYAYDLAGHLKLVYPQDRDLQQPTSISINSRERLILITEKGTRSVTVFGY